jgi:hypothetical protein
MASNETREPCQVQNVEAELPQRPDDPLVAPTWADYDRWLASVNPGSVEQNPFVAHAICLLESTGKIQAYLSPGSIDARLLSVFVDYLRAYAGCPWARMTDALRQERAEQFFRFVLRALGFTVDAPTQAAWWRRQADHAEADLIEHGGTP